MDSYEAPANTSQSSIIEEAIDGLLSGARLRTEKEVEEKRDSKRRRPSEKDRNKEDEDDEDEEDEEDKEEIPESKKAKKSPVKTKPRKRGRPSGKDKDKEDKEDKEDREDIPESRKVKRAPRKRINLKKNKETKEKCIFCQEEYLRETLWEDVDKQQPNILQVSICKSCHACFKDDVVMKEIRETIKKKHL